MKKITAPVNPNNTLKNYLLAALHADEFLHLEPKLEPVSFKLGDVLYESGDKMDYVYFPTTAIVSMLYVMENGSTAEIGIVGNDGLIGVSLFMGGDTTTSRAIIQSAGALQISHPRRAIRCRQQSPEFRQLQIVLAYPADSADWLALHHGQHILKLFD